VRAASTRELSEVGAVALAVATWIGVAAARPVPTWCGAAVVASALLVRRPWLLVGGALVLGSALSAGAWGGLVAARPATYTGRVRLAADPGEVGAAVRADVVLDDGRRVEAWARGTAAGRLRGLLAGETVAVAGQLAPPPDPAPWLVPRHVVGRLSITAVTSDADPGAPWTRLANGYHRLLVAGAAALPTDQQPLLAGFVLGDDRGEDPAVASDFRSSGLSHLLVVSGENVAFVLALAAPLVSRLRLSWRLATTLGVLAWFAVLTRFEPSVLRATCMAGIAAIAAFRGRTLSGVRVLALAVTVLLLVDPLLSTALGFRLSVAASAAIVLLAPPLARRLRGPTWLRQSTAVAVAAQVGVAPVLVPAFGGVPAVSVGANLLAVPAAGPVMMWGLVVGPVAGVLRLLGADGPAAAVLLPIRLLLGWVAGVARVGASAPLGLLGWPQLAVLGAAAALVAGAARTRRRWLASSVRAVALGGAVAVVLGGALGPPVPASAGADVVATGVDLWRSSAGGAVVTLSGHAGTADAVLDGLRARGVRELDAVVLASATRPATDVVVALRARLDVGLVWQPDGGSVPDATAPAPGDHLDAAGVIVDVRRTSPTLLVDVGVEAGSV
jgi:competence protein ComEC